MQLSDTSLSSSNAGSNGSLAMTRIYAEQVKSEDAIKAYKPIETGEG